MAATIKLAWNQFDAQAPRTLSQLLDDKDFTDVTLASEDGQHIRAHQAILSSSSPFFRNILMKHKHNSPLIYLSGIKSSIIHSVISFIYTGSCGVLETDLEEFIRVGKYFSVSGIGEVGIIDVQDTLDSTTTDLDLTVEDLDSSIEDLENSIERVKPNTSEEVIQLPPLRIKMNEELFQETSFEENLIKDIQSSLTEDYINGIYDLLSDEEKEIPAANGSQEKEISGTILFGNKEHKVPDHLNEKAEEHVIENSTQKNMESETVAEIGMAENEIETPSRIVCADAKLADKEKELIGLTYKRVTRSVVSSVKKENLECDLCSFTTRRRDHLNQHKKGKHGCREYKCDICDFLAGYKSQLIRHRAEKHANQKFECKTCDYKTTRKDNFKNHKCRNIKLEK